MLNRCRFCGLSKGISTFRDITEDSTVQDNIKKCGIRLEDNEFLPKKCCSICYRTIEEFCEFLDKIEQTQEELKQDLIKKPPAVRKIKKEVVEKGLVKIQKAGKQAKVRFFLILILFSLKEN
jgi:hypothetical protein